MLALFAAASGRQSAKYIEDLFSPYLYTGTGATQTITNNINLSVNGGLVWIKSRSAATNNNLFDTAQGVTKSLHSNTTDSTVTDANSLTAFNTTGFTLGSGNTAGNEVNTSSATYVSWTFQEQAKFFDIVTYTGTGANRTISHSLGSVPGCIMVKRTDTTSDWQVYHSGLANTEYMVLNTTAAKATGATRWNSTTPTSTVFSLGTDTSVNASGGTYVAYLFASNAGGFGSTGLDNVISCGSFTTDGSAMATVNLGYEPQWLLIKASSTPDQWYIVDSMRGWPANGNVTVLSPNGATAETTQSGYFNLTSTGFATIPSQGGPIASATFIYIAIRRGPMEVPTDATKVFLPYTYITPTVQDTGTAVDSVLGIDVQTANVALWGNRLTGAPTLDPRSTNAETTGFGLAFSQGRGTSYTPTGVFGEKTVSYGWSRAPGFFDEVCYTGTGSVLNVSHNLGVVPELMIVKVRNNNTWDWCVYAAPLGNTNYLRLNDTFASAAALTLWNSTSPTSSVFTLGTGADVNGSSAYNYVAYLFATCAGVSKVGSYTGTATTKQINCNFASGARFVLIKRTDSTGDWYVWDSARGITSGNDPYLLLNNIAAEVTSTDYIDTYSAGFEITNTAPAAINANGGTFIFLAIA
jgi:hypothetical protein